MKCSMCGQNLIIVGSDMVSPKDTDEITVVTKRVCRNADCPSFCGVDQKKNIKTDRKPLKQSKK